LLISTMRINSFADAAKFAVRCALNLVASATIGD
jgi:hypothetical protein